MKYRLSRSSCPSQPVHRRSSSFFLLFSRQFDTEGSERTRTSAKREWRMRNNQAFYFKEFGLRKVKYAWASQVHKDGKALSFKEVVFCYANCNWRGILPRGDDKRVDLHDESFILKSLTWYWQDYRRLANDICFSWEKQVSVAVNKFPAAFIFIRALDHF